VAEFKRILLTGGGTSGHVNPALAIGQGLAGEGTTLLYVGVRSGQESHVVPAAGIPIVFVRASAFPSLRKPGELLRFGFNLFCGFWVALWVLLVRFRPDLIVGTGAFASAPVMAAAFVLRKLGWRRAHIYIHEQNAAPGRLNKLFGSVVDRVFVVFPQAVAAFPGKGVVTGLPIRRSIAPTSRSEAVQRLAADAKTPIVVPPGRQVVLVFGGSLGARTINRALVDALRHLLPLRKDLFIIHGLGNAARTADYAPVQDTQQRITDNYSEVERQAIGEFYISHPYLDNIADVYAVSDLAVIRGGANSLNEVAALGLPALVIPKTGLPGEHQVMNARALAACGGGIILYEETVFDPDDGFPLERLDGELLASTILSLLRDQPRLEEMGRKGRTFLRQDAMETIRRIIGRDFAGGRATALPESDSMPTPAPSTSPVPPALLLTSQALLGQLESRCNTLDASYRIEEIIPSPDDRLFYTSRAASLLASSAWDQRNVGVKLLGLLQAREKLSLLVGLLNDRRPAPRLHRMLGGDYRQVGFIRRNGLTALARFGVVNPEVEQLLMAGLADPYFEVRSEAVRTIMALADRLPDRARYAEPMKRLLSDRWLEVVENALLGLGEVGAGDECIPILMSYRSAKYWKLRAAALRALRTLLRRGEVRDPTTLRGEVESFILTSTHVTPVFQVKKAYGELIGELRARGGANP
jgi:UDP-N-acetylglucosamine--N-acetylmuramyl-(pentapeptide) pyrophosphoryl-undecaprenol N-acetylglucosamine transferase